MKSKPYYEIADNYFKQTCELTRFETKEEWLHLRMEGIGGSDVSSIVGHNRYRNRKDVYKSKKQVDEQIHNYAIDFGNDFEDIIAEAFEAKYKHQYAVLNYKNVMFRNIFTPCIQASLDRVLVEKDTNKVGILEIKTGQDKKSKWYYSDGSRGIPQEYIDQAIHYFNVTNAEFVVFYTLINNNNLQQDCDMQFLRPRRIERNDCLDYMNYVLKECVSFWNDYVKIGVEPNNRFIM